MTANQGFKMKFRQCFNALRCFSKHLMIPGTNTLKANNKEQIPIHSNFLMQVMSIGSIPRMLSRFIHDGNELRWPIPSNMALVLGFITPPERIPNNSIDGLELIRYLQPQFFNFHFDAR